MFDSDNLFLCLAAWENNVDGQNILLLLAFIGLTISIGKMISAWESQRPIPPKDR